MIDFFLNFFLVILIIVGLLGVMVVLMQRTSSQAGMGAALSGGGAADQAFGAESATVLTKATQVLTIVFFVLSFLLYLGYQARYAGDSVEDGESLLPETPVMMDESGDGDETDSGAVTEVEVGDTEGTSGEPQP